MSWEDAQAYVDWLSGKTGADYRLLSAVEWEYAAHVGTTGPSREDDDDFMFDDQSVDDSTESMLRALSGAAPVGLSPANDFGLHDMDGNVREWVEGCWDESYAGAPLDGRGWGSFGCVLVGGRSYDIRGDYQTGIWFPLHTGPDTVYRDDFFLGFRVARTLAR